jgi:hypothetical protein
MKNTTLYKEDVQFNIYNSTNNINLIHPFFWQWVLNSSSHTC